MLNKKISFHNQYCSDTTHAPNFCEIEFQATPLECEDLLTFFKSTSPQRPKFKDNKADDTRKLGTEINSPIWNDSTSKLKEGLTSIPYSLGVVIDDHSKIPIRILEFTRKYLKVHSHAELFAMFIITPAKMFIPPHCERRALVLNILLQNVAEKTFVTFHNQDGQLLDIHTFSEGKNCVTYNTSQWHAVWNHSEHDRIALSFSRQSLHKQPALEKGYLKISKELL